MHDHHEHNHTHEHNHAHTHEHTHDGVTHSHEHTHAHSHDHAHPHEQITYIISGRCRYTVGAETKEVGTGDSVLIPGNVPHSIAVLETMKVIDAFAPAREDFL